MGERGTDRGALRILVVYRDPADYPGRYVVRGQTAHAHGIRIDPDPVGVVDSLAAARALIPPGLHRLDRDPADVPQIVECWL